MVMYHGKVLARHLTPGLMKIPQLLPRCEVWTLKPHEVSS